MWISFQCKLGGKVVQFRMQINTRFLLEKDLPLGFIQYKLMSLLGHSNFSTTQKYIDLARTITYDKRMKSWVEDVFGGLEQELNVEATELEVGIR